MVGLFKGLLRGLKVHLRAFCCKARGGGGRLRHAPHRENEKRECAMGSGSD